MCPWPLAVQAVDGDGQPVSRPHKAEALLVRIVSPDQAAAARAEVADARRRRAAARTPRTLRPAAEEPTPIPQEPQAQRPTDALHQVPVGELPVLGYSHAPDHYHGWTEPVNFRPLGPDPVVRGARPERGAGLWTSPATAVDSTGRILATVWSTGWEADGGDPTAYSEHLRITPEDGARVVLIDRREDLEALVAAYPNPPADLPFDDSHLFPDWVQVAADWDSVYLTAAGAAVLGHEPEKGEEPHLQGWFGATVFWLQPAYSVADGLGL
jgi:hypothetical protein